ncbi:unnamed protein product [Closterium sp. Naga37s-1]|nr:unnamed protein product [Closterium sp. Naga37s-1]
MPLCWPLVCPGHTSASRDIAAPQQFARSRETLAAFTPEIVTAVENHENSGGQSLESAVRESAAADAEAAKALAEYEDAKKALEGKKVDAEGISSEASRLRGQAEELAFDHAVIATEVAESAERERKSTADLKRAEEAAEKAAAYAAGKRKVADETSAAAGEAARLAEAAGTAEAQLALVQANSTRAEAVRAAEVAETLAVEAKKYAEEVWEAFSHEESDMDISMVDLVSEEAYIEDLNASAAGLEEEYQKMVTAVTQLTEQNILIGVQQCRIQNLEADSVKLQALIEQLTREVQLIPKENDTSSLIQDLHNTLQFVQDQLKKQEKSISVLQTQYREIRRGNLYQPAPAAERVANAANSRAAPADAPPAVPPPTGARAEPPTAAATAFGSCPSALPRFVHGKTDVETWLSIAEDFMSIHNVRSEARVVAATLALDDTASKLVYANKRHAEANGHPFGWEEFKAAMLAAFLSQPPALEVRSRLENIQCGDQPVREYAKEFEKTLSLLKTALPESEVIHQFFKGLPEHIKRVHVVRGEHQWRTYKECKEQVIDTDVNFRAYMTHARAQQQPSAEGPRGGGNRTQAHRGSGSWKRPYQQKGESSGTQSKRAHAGPAKDPQDEDKPPAGCRICGKLGHKSYHCRWRKSVKNSGKPNQGKKPDGSGPSGPKDFPKSN